MSDLADDAAALAPLADRGPVHVYDQVGSGASSRLADPGEYTNARALADLGAVVADTRVPRVVLIGHSWGARYALAYAALHPDQVAAVVLTSPGPPLLAEEPLPPPQPADRLGAGDRLRLYATAAAPRTLFTYTLASLQPRRAHRVVGDAEMDARFTRLYRRTAPALFCDRALGDEVDPSGVGFFVYQAQQRDPGPSPVTLADLADLDTPVLVVRGACDYVDPVIADTYARLVPDLTRVDPPGAGHLAYRETPGPWADAVRRFLTEKAGG